MSSIRVGNPEAVYSHLVWMIQNIFTDVELLRSPNNYGSHEWHKPTILMHSLEVLHIIIIMSILLKYNNPIYCM